MAEENYVELGPMEFAIGGYAVHNIDKVPYVQITDGDGKVLSDNPEYRMFQPLDDGSVAAIRQNAFGINVTAILRPGEDGMLEEESSSLGIDRKIFSDMQIDDYRNFLSGSQDRQPYYAIRDVHAWGKNFGMVPTDVVKVTGDQVDFGEGSLKQGNFDRWAETHYQFREMNAERRRDEGWKNPLESDWIKPMADRLSDEEERMRIFESYRIDKMEFLSERTAFEVAVLANPNMREHYMNYAKGSESLDLDKFLQTRHGYTEIAEWYAELYREGPLKHLSNNAAAYAAISERMETDPILREEVRGALHFEQTVGQYKQAFDTMRPEERVSYVSYYFECQEKAFNPAFRRAFEEMVEEPDRYVIPLREGTVSLKDKFGEMNRERIDLYLKGGMDPARKEDFETVMRQDPELKLKAEVEARRAEMEREAAKEGETLSNPETEEEKIAQEELFDRYLRGEMTPEEKAAFEAMLANNPELRADFEAHRDIAYAAQRMGLRDFLNELREKDNKVEMEEAAKETAEKAEGMRQSYFPGDTVDFDSEGIVEKEEEVGEENVVKEAVESQGLQYEGELFRRKAETETEAKGEETEEDEPSVEVACGVAEYGADFEGELFRRKSSTENAVKASEGTYEVQGEEPEVQEDFSDGFELDESQEIRNAEGKLTMDPEDMEEPGVEVESKSVMAKVDKGEVDTWSPSDDVEEVFTLARDPLSGKVGMVTLFENVTKKQTGASCQPIKCEFDEIKFKDIGTKMMFFCKDDKGDWTVMHTKKWNEYEQLKGKFSSYEEALEAARGYAKAGKAEQKGMETGNTVRMESKREKHEEKVAGQNEGQKREYGKKGGYGKGGYQKKDYQKRNYPKKGGGMKR